MIFILPCHNCKHLVVDWSRDLGTEYIDVEYCNYSPEGVNINIELFSDVCMYKRLACEVVTGTNEFKRGDPTYIKSYQEWIKEHPNQEAA